MTQASAGWLVPDWPAPAGVRAVHTTRVGGVSAPPYDSMNLGDHVGDAAAAVAANRGRLAQSLAPAPAPQPVFMQQVHGSAVAELPAQQHVPVADACMTLATDTVCAIMVADCLPVLLADQAGRIVAGAHAGWRGLAGHDGHGVLEATVTAMREALRGQGGRDSPTLLAWLGPCIGPDAFEVGAEVRAAFVAREPLAAALFKPCGQAKWLADLAGLARLRLRALGVEDLYGNDGGRGWCTAGNPSLFFSHRRDGVSGRMAACIWRSG